MNTHLGCFVYHKVASIELLNIAHDHRSSRHPGSEKTLLSLLGAFFLPGMYKGIRTLRKSCLTSREYTQNQEDHDTTPIEKWGEDLLNPFHTVRIYLQ